MVGGGGGAHLAAIVYDVDLTLDLPRPETVGTALNALAHCAEALYVRGRNDASDERALEGAELIVALAPARGRGARTTARRATGLLRGAAAAGEALALAGLGLAHAMAQALGGTLRPAARRDERALTLPPALRFNAADRAGGGRALRRGDRRADDPAARRGARAARRVRAAARLRRSRGRAARGRRGRGRPRRATGTCPRPGDARPRSRQLLRSIY